MAHIIVEPAISYLYWEIIFRYRKHSLISLIYGPDAVCVNSCIMHCDLLVHHHGMLPSSNSTSNFIAAWYEKPNGTFLKW